MPRWASIAPQSGHDRASIVLSILNQRPSDDRGVDSTMKEPRSRLDHTAIVEFFHEPSQPSDGDQVRNAWSRSRDHASLSSSVRWKSDAPRVSTKRRGSRFTVAVRWRSHGLNFDEDRELLMTPRVARYALRSTFTYAIFLHMLH